MPSQGTQALLDLARELRETAPKVRSICDLKRGARLMETAAEALQRLAEYEPDVEAVTGEN